MPIRIPVRRVLPGILALLVAGAWANDAHSSPNVQAALIVDGDAAVPGLALDVGIRLRMRPGWHVYWKNPGDSGLPPSVTWTLPSGFKAGPIEWPPPERFLDEGLMTYGYRGEVILPVRIHTPDRIPGDSVLIGARIDWLECKDICLPGTTALRALLPVRAERRMFRPSSWVLWRARSRLPAPPVGWPLEAESGPRAVCLSFVPPRGTNVHRAYFYADQPLQVDYAAPQGFERSGQYWRLTMRPAPNANPNLTRLTGVLEVEGRAGVRAFLVDAPLRSGDPAPAAPQPLVPARTPPAACIVAVLAGLVAVVALIALRILRRRAHRT